MMLRNSKFNACFTITLDNTSISASIIGTLKWNPETIKTAYIRPFIGGERVCDLVQMKSTKSGGLMFSQPLGFDP